MVLPAAGSSSRWRMGGLGFGLPLSRLYARYFGVLPCRPLLMSLLLSFPIMDGTSHM